MSEQIQQMEALARQHFPDDLEQQNACLVRMLKERLQTYAAMSLKVLGEPPRQPVAGNH